VSRPSETPCQPPRLLRRNASRSLGVACWVVLGLGLISGPRPLHADVKTGSSEKPAKKEKKDKKAQDFLPEAIDRSAGFVAGGSVDIELEASVATLQQVIFIIRQPPLYGTLSAMRPHPRDSNRCIVTYTHGGVGEPVADRFTFACRVGDGPISAPATVTLTGQKYEPILNVENITAMGKVFLGGESSLRFTVKNVGPAPYSADLSWEFPWRGPPHLELKAGGSAELSVAFQPYAAGIFRLDRLLQPGQNSSRLVLYGECVRPLIVSPGKLVLTLSGDNGAREGTLLLANGLSSPQKARFKMPPRLAGATTVEVPGSGQVKVTLSLPPQDAAAFKGEIKISTQDGSETVSVESDAKPAVLQMVKPADGVLDLGTIPQGGEAQGVVVLKNNGGMSAVVQALRGASVQISPEGEAVRIEAGAEGQFLVTFHGEQMGHLQTEAHIQGAGLVLRVPIKVNVTARLPEAKAPDLAETGVAGSATPGGGASSDATAQEGAIPPQKTPLFKPMIAYLSATGLPVPRQNINPYLERVHEVQIRERTSSSVTIAWNKPDVMPAGWAVEMASWTRIPTGELVKTWNPVKDWEAVDAGEHYVGARFKSLPSGTHIEVRIMGVDRDGKVAEPVVFAMETRTPWQVPSWVWQVFWGFALAVVLAGLYRIREGYWDPAWRPLRRLLRL
jgi:hypothetical protein